MDIELLKQALENENNLNLINKNIQDIKKEKNDILQQLCLNRDDLKTFNSKLKDYRYIDDIKDFNYGFNIRWINLNKLENIYICNGAILCDIKTLSKGIGLYLKTYNNKFITIYLNKNLIFQRISDQEKILLKAINYLSK